MSFEFKVDLLAQLDKQLKQSGDATRRYRSPKIKPTIWPTEASVQWEASNGLVITEGACHRAMWYRLNKYPVTDEPIDRMHWVWRAGGWWEDECNKLSEQMGTLAGKNIKIQDMSMPLFISGEIDGVNTYKKEDGSEGLFVIDYKSTGGSYYNQVKLIGNRNHEPFPKVENLLQLMVYLHVDSKLDFGMLAYLIRDKMDRTQFEIELERDEDTGFIVAKVNGKTYPEYSVNEIYRRYTLICDHYQKGTLPPRDYDFEYTDEQAVKLNEIKQLTDTGLKKHLSGKPKDRQGHWRCIDQDTLVKMKDGGWRKIKDVQVNDWVKVGEHELYVQKQLDQGVQDNIVEMKPYLLMDYKCTKDHEIYASRIDARDYSKNWRQTVEDSFKFTAPEMMDREKYRWYLQLPFSSEFKNDDWCSEELLFLLAQFITEGSYHYNEDGNCYKIQLTYSVEEKETAEQAIACALDLGATSGSIKEYIDLRAERPRKSLKVRIYGVQLAKLLREYIGGRYSYDKYFKEPITTLPPERQRVLLDLMLKQDGSLLSMSKSSVENYSTTSPALALQVQEMYLRNGQVASIVKQKSGTTDFGYMTCETRDGYHVRYFRDTKSRVGWITEDNILIVTLNKILPTDPTHVYDLSITSSPVFVTQGGLVHNCNYCNYREHCEKDGPT